jgi:hypothetical protein
VADVIASGLYAASWKTADGRDAATPGSGAAQVWEVCQDAAYEVIEFPEAGHPEQLRESVAAAAKRVCLCFEQQMLAQDAHKSPRAVQRSVARVLDQAGL